MYKSGFQTENKISFASIVQDSDAYVRVTDDGYLVAVDLAMLVTGKKKTDAVKVLRNLKEKTFSASKFTTRDFPGAGNKGVCLVAIDDAIELIMVLPGNTAKEMRGNFANVLHRYYEELTGDSMSASNTSMAPLVGVSFPVAADPPVEDTQELGRKRKRADLELANLELDVQERTEFVKAKSLANCTAEQTIRAAELANLNAMTTSYGALCQDVVMDERARMIFKDNYLNICWLCNRHALQRRP